MKLHLTDLKKLACFKKIYSLAKDKNAQVYLVGGFLRDCLLGRDIINLDFDFAAKPDSLGFAKELSRRLKVPFVLLNEPHGCARLIIQDSQLSANLDFSSFRALTIEADLEKRDFTINALALNLSDIFNPKVKDLKSLIIDPYAGRKDLKRMIVAITHKNNFKDDPLRMLRAYSLTARLGFKIEKATLELINKNSKLIKSSASERLRDELFKIFSVKVSNLSLIGLAKSSLLEVIIPEIKSMYQLKQGAYHHLDVWAHTLETFKKLEEIVNNEHFGFKRELKEYLGAQVTAGHRRLELLKFVSLLHDVGKPATFRVEKGRVHFYGHERVGMKMAESISYRLKLSTKEIKALKTIIYWHLRVGYMADIKNLSQRAIFRYFRDCAEEAVSVAILSLADQRATRGSLKRSGQRQRHERLVKFLIRQFFKREKEEKPIRLVDGNDIMKNLKIEPGKKVGEILNEINEAQAEGAVRTKEEALEWAKRFYQMKPKVME